VPAQPVDAEPKLKLVAAKPVVAPRSRTKPKVVSVKRARA
jgi:hypothetical protein